MPITTDVSIEYKPLIAKVEANQRKPKRKIAFVEKQLCFFENDIDDEDFGVGQDIEVMVTRGFYGVYPPNHQRPGETNHRYLRALMIRPADVTRYSLVRADGFHQTGEEMGILSTGYPLVDPKRKLLLTPSVTNIVFDNGLKDRRVGLHRVSPTLVWVENHWLDGNIVEYIPIAGLTRLEDGLWYNLVTRRRNRDK
jgi:hypothetical protein